MSTQRPQAKPVVYFAGKIARNGWREILVGERAGIAASQAGHAVDAKGRALTELYDPRHFVDCGTFVLNGPFFVDFGHGAGHGPQTHGREDGFGNSQKAVFANCLLQLETSDLVFAFINETDCHGTLIEIGYAHALGIPIFLCFGPNITENQKRDLWFAQHASAMVSRMPIELAFRKALNTWRSAAKTAGDARHV